MTISCSGFFSQFTFLLLATSSQTQLNTVHSSSNLDAEECEEDDLGDVLCPALSPGKEEDLGDVLCPALSPVEER